MISFLRGQLAESFPNRAIVEVNGVGYEVWIPISTYDRLPHPGVVADRLGHDVARSGPGFLGTAYLFVQERGGHLRQRLAAESLLQDEIGQGL